MNKIEFMMWFYYHTVLGCLQDLMLPRGFWWLLFYLYFQALTLLVDNEREHVCQHFVLGSWLFTSVLPIVVINVLKAGFFHLLHVHSRRDKQVIDAYKCAYYCMSIYLFLDNIHLHCQALWFMFQSSKNGCAG